MTLLQPSFRGRLRLFFAVIVVIPMVAVGRRAVPAARRDGQRASWTRGCRQAQTGGDGTCYETRREDAMAAARAGRRTTSGWRRRSTTRTRRRSAGGSISWRGGSTRERIELVVDGRRDASRPARRTRSRPRAGALQDANGRRDRADHGVDDVRRGIRARVAAAARGAGARSTATARCWRRRSRRSRTSGCRSRAGPTSPPATSTTGSSRFTARGARRRR